MCSHHFVFGPLAFEVRDRKLIKKKSNRVLVDAVKYPLKSQLIDKK